MTWLGILAVGLLFHWLLRRFVLGLPKLDALKLALKQQIAAHPEADGERIASALRSLEERLRADRIVRLARGMAIVAIALALILGLVLYGAARPATDEVLKGRLVLIAIAAVAVFLCYRVQVGVVRRRFEEELAERSAETFRR